MTRLAGAKLITTYNMFMFEAMKAHLATKPTSPKAIHYRGDGEFMISGTNTGKYRGRFKPEIL